MNIGEQRRTIYIEPIEDPAPMEEPAPPLEPDREPEHDRPEAAANSNL
jgi:hypothetical protein